MRRLRLAALPLLLIVAVAAGTLRRSPAGEKAAEPTTPDRSPVDLVLTADGKWLLTANETANTVSLVDLASGTVKSEAPCGQRPAALALTPDGKHVLVSGTYSGDVTVLALQDGSLKKTATIAVGFEPRGIAVAPDGKRAYVAMTTAHAVGVLDLEKNTLADKIAVKRWPRYLALTTDGKTLAVGTSGDGGVSVVDTAAKKLLYAEEFAGINLGQMHISKDQKHVWFPWMVYRHNPITPNNIRIGWVLASRIARVKLDGPARREAISLDPQGKAIADPHGLAVSPNEDTLVCSASGSQELLVYRTAGLPLQDYGGTDHIPPVLLKDEARFHRIILGGRPMAVRFGADGKQVFVANYMLNAVQVVDLAGKKVAHTIDLGGPKEPTLARRGAAIFFDGKRSLDQWYSCHSCHYEGHSNSVSMDTRNDGRFGNFKTVLSLRNVTRTGPYFWHGWEPDLKKAVRRSLTDSMLGPQPTEADVDALLAFFDTLTPPPNPYRQAGGTLTEAAKRGEQVFRGAKANCARCHSGEFFTDGRIHSVGTNDRGDVYKGYNPPSLLGVHDRIQYLHDGRARSLEDVLRGAHSPDKVSGNGELTEQELQDLLAYVRSL